MTEQSRLVVPEMHFYSIIVVFVTPHLESVKLSAKSILWTCQTVAGFCLLHNVSSQGRPVRSEL